MTKPEIIICRDADELNRRVAERFVVLADAAGARTGRFTVALAGGSTPRALYALLATPGFASRIPWLRVQLFWGDERCVPPDHAESNYRMARESLLSKIAIPEKNIHRIAGEKEPKVAAAEYEHELIRFFHLAAGGLPRFDLILLGVGEDGHTASLFPGGAALDDTEPLVASVYVERLKAQRITLTLPALNAGAQVFFLVAGQSKAAIVKELLEADSASAKLPAQRVRPVRGALTWFIARDAAAALPDT